MAPSQTLASKSIAGKKKDKTRITVALCVNLDGTHKLEPIVINQFQNPRCFKGVDVSKLPIAFFANKNAWMTSKIFTDWLKSFNLKMHNRKVLLLLDNASSHVSLELSNVRIEFLPPNTTSHLQPMDAGIIRNVKLHYKTLFVRWMIDRLEKGTEVKKMDVLTAINKVGLAWEDVSLNTIRNCWAHTGIVSASMITELKQHNEPKRSYDFSPLDALIDKLSLADPMPASDYVDCDGDDIHGTREDISDMGELPEDLGDDDENCPLSHRKAISAASQLTTYAFAHNIEFPQIKKLEDEIRKRLLGSLRQKSITSFFDK